MPGRNEGSLSPEVLFRLHAEALQSKRVQLTENIDVSILLNMACLKYKERDRLKAVLSSRGSMEAAEKLLDVLIAKTGWWDEFLEVVRGYCEQGYLADMLEAELGRLRGAHRVTRTPDMQPDRLHKNKEGNEARRTTGKSPASQRLLRHIHSKENDQRNRSSKPLLAASWQGPRSGEGASQTPVQEPNRSDTYATNGNGFRQVIKHSLMQLSNRHKWREICKLLLPVSVKDQQTSTLEDGVHLECQTHLPSVLTALAHFRFSLGSTLCRLAGEYSDGADTRELVYHCLFRLAHEESRKLEGLGWGRAHIRPVLGTAPVSVATQTPPEDSNARDESEEQLVAKVIKFLNIPHSRTAWTREVQTQNIPQGASFKELVTNAIGATGAAITAPEHTTATSEDSDAATGHESSYSGDESASSSSSLSDEDQVDAKHDAGGGARDGSGGGKARQEHARRQHQRHVLTADAVPAARDAVLESPATDNLCTDCGVREVTLVLLPCGHFCLCFHCARGATRCPVCDAAIEMTLRAYKN